MAPLVAELKRHPNKIESKVLVTAQHRHMLDQVLDIFGITPDFDLDIMQDSQSLEQITTGALNGISQILKAEKPDLILVHGDTTTTMAASLAGFYNQIAVGHVEAGLRSFDKYSPFPEEINRKVTGVIAQYHFAPTFHNWQNLVNEGVDETSIFVTGNTVIDAIKMTVRDDYEFKNEKLKAIPELVGDAVRSNPSSKKQHSKSSKPNIHLNPKSRILNPKIILLTAHRRENLGQPLENICQAAKSLAENNDVTIIYPVHLNPKVLEPANRILGSLPNVHLTLPLEVDDLHNLMAKCSFVLTDSGGLQEEAPSLGKPVLVLRTETERPEAVDAGTVKVIGVQKEHIIMEAERLLYDQEAYNKMAKAANPYGDGTASEKIVAQILTMKP